MFRNFAKNPDLSPVTSTAVHVHVPEAKQRLKSVNRKPHQVQ